MSIETTTAKKGNGPNQDHIERKFRRNERAFYLAFAAGLPAGFVASGVVQQLCQDWPYGWRLAISSVAAGIAAAIIIMPLYLAIRGSPSNKLG